jgi:hypothetical protein
MNNKHIAFFMTLFCAFGMMSASTLTRAAEPQPPAAVKPDSSDTCKVGVSVSFASAVRHDRIDTVEEGKIIEANVVVEAGKFEVRQRKDLRST